ncbi:hypothetical protein TNCV_381081 [Trichonephila clavipes]|uniref:Uncharacterized protein n=1 Tax=Trichonephila clavipes TaxID=2585209 RepID=A0A8X6SDU6_TRICX|nr:hypothetical protein TNCV_381081 [Trichonephila clavipes]
MRPSHYPKTRMDLGKRTVATRRLLATDLVSLNHGQVTRTTPELASPSPNFHTTTTGGRLNIGRFYLHHPLPYTADTRY